MSFSRRDFELSAKTVLGRARFKGPFKAQAALEFKYKATINSYLYQNLKLDDLVFFTGLSLSSFKIRIETLFLESPKQHINLKKLEGAKLLLEATTLKVSKLLMIAHIMMPLASLRPLTLSLIRLQAQSKKPSTNEKVF